MKWLLIAAALLVAGPAAAQMTGAATSTPPSYSPGTHPLSLDLNGNLRVGASATNPLPVSTGPKVYTIIPPDISTVTTGGTAVNALSAGHATAGGLIENPITATVNLCINQGGTADVITSGLTFCIAPGVTFNVVPNAGAVSVNASDSAHVFGAEGFN